MRTLIIPDIHNKIDRADAIIERVPHDQVLFLGDYFDDFFDDDDVARRVARWLAASFRKPGRVHLIGNHDAHYLFPNYPIISSGYSEAKHVAIKFIMDTETINPSDYLRLHHWVDGWLVSHAGIANAQIVGAHEGNLLSVDEAALMAMQHLESGYLSPMLNVGRTRGGKVPVGGIFWCDWERELGPGLDGIRQIVGHSPGKQPRVRDGNWCLDTHLNHYAVIENGSLTIEAV